jgi:undecaprenyl-diphosphatase
MTLTQAFVLALIQAITEFCPISSSAHLILMPRLLGWTDQGLVFDIMTNTGSMLAVMLYFRHDLWAILRSFLVWLRAPRFGERAELAPALALGTLPILVAGFLFSDWVATAARDPRIIAGASIFFGILLGIADRTAREDRPLGTLRWRDAMLVGAAQALAIVPGTSRSGATMTAGLFLGYSRADAARFSFLLSIPVGLAVLAYDAIELAEAGPPAGGWAALAVGLVVSMVASYAVIDLLLGWLRKRGLMVFVVYRVLLGVAILAVLNL